MLEMESWCGHYESLPFITSETISRAVSFLQISAALSWESLSLLDSSFRIMQRWEMGRLRVRGLCTHACGNVHACDRRCLLWLELIALWMQNTSAKGRNCDFHSLLKHKKAYESADLVIISWSATQNGRFKEISRKKWWNRNYLGGCPTLPFLPDFWKEKFISAFIFKLDAIYCLSKAHFSLAHWIHGPWQAMRICPPSLALGANMWKLARGYESWPMEAEGQRRESIPNR